ncbi:MAG: hypothetical protein HRT43_13410 [Campylobacteraceae bacterium]|nr:hypothetical protein [Campylobacteraceae bacterium]
MTSKRFHISLDDCDEDYANDVKTVNQHNLKLLKEILVMLESRELAKVSKVSP